MPPGMAPGAGATGPGPGIQPGWLASSADRERAVGVLRAGFAEGRLTQGELDDRIARAYAARSYGQLWALTGDLPAGALPYPGPHAGMEPRPDAGPPGAWGPAAALIVTALVIFTLAALVTAIVTAHAGQPVFMPLQQHVHLAPYIISQRHVHT